MFVEGDDPAVMYELKANTLDPAVERIRADQTGARQGDQESRRRWPMIVLRSPKEWTGPKAVDGLRVEGTFRSHQVPLQIDADRPEHLAQFEAWMRSYKPAELFDENGRLLGPDETLSNLLGAVFEVTDRQWDADVVAGDEFLAPAGRVLDSMLSEHQSQGWLEGYLLTAVSILREHLPELKIRVVNVVDLMKLPPESEHPHGLSDAVYDAIFTPGKHIIFAFHGYPWLIHRLTYRRTNRNLHVRGYMEESTITTPFDMRVQNHLDRFHLVQDVVDRLPQLAITGVPLRQRMDERLAAHTRYLNVHGVDLPEIRNWTWEGQPVTGAERMPAPVRRGHGDAAVERTPR